MCGVNEDGSFFSGCRRVILTECLRVLEAIGGEDCVERMGSGEGDRHQNVKCRVFVFR